MGSRKAAAAKMAAKQASVFFGKPLTETQQPPRPESASQSTVGARRTASLEVSRFCSQISWSDTFRVQLPADTTSSCAKSVPVLASSSLAVSVLAVFSITKPVVEAEAELLRFSTLVRHCVSSDLVVGDI